MISGSQVYQVARSVARGDGEWAEVPRCVREAIVLSLSHPPNAAGAERSRSSHAEGQASAGPPPAMPPVLSEGLVQRSVQTFEDGAWVRDQAVRTYAQFHNTVETLHTGMRGQLRALWRTAMQLNPAILDEVRRQYNLAPTDSIPDGIPIAAEQTARILRQEAVLDELIEDLQRLRDSSVRFAAHWLTDREMMAMGANPAYLRPELLERNATALNPRGTGTAHGTAGQRPASPTGARRRSPHSRRHAASPTASTSVSPRSRAQASNDEYAVPRDDPTLRKLRREYVTRLEELSRRADEYDGDDDVETEEMDSGRRRSRSHRSSSSSRGRGYRSPRAASRRPSSHSRRRSADASTRPQRRASTRRR